LIFLLSYIILQDVFANKLININFCADVSGLLEYVGIIIHIIRVLLFNRRKKRQNTRFRPFLHIYIFKFVFIIIHQKV